MPEYTAKDIYVAPIKSANANALVKRIHYSGKVVQNSQLHFGVFLGGRLEGVMQFGPSLDKRKIQGLVENTLWNGFIELNRMAFSDRLPRNSESRAIGIAMRLIRKHYPHIEWVISFADGTQCGDGTIYRASGFVLTGIKVNTQVWAAADGNNDSRTALTDNKSRGSQLRAQAVISRTTVTKAGNNFATGAASMKAYEAIGFKPLKGFQLRYVYFISPKAKERLTVPIIPFAKIEEVGASMYLGQTIKRPKQAESGPPEMRRGSTDPDAPSISQAE